MKASIAHSSRGVAYLALMIVIALIGVVTANAVQLGSVHGQREAEDELLFIGEELQDALRRYADASPLGLPRAPRDVNELLRDPRYPGVVRHLRKLYVDPLTGETDWVMVFDMQGRIVGVHSRSSRKPIRNTGFKAGLSHLEGRNESYQSWMFWGPLRPADSMAPGIVQSDENKPGAGDRWLLAR